MPRLQYHMTKIGYALVRDLLPIFWDRPFTPSQAAKAIGRPIKGSVFWGLRQENIIKTMNNLKRRHCTKAGIKEEYQFTPEFLIFVEYGLGRELMAKEAV